MKIAFLGTGRMGSELALHLLGEHDVVAWNRTPERTARLAAAGARVAATASDALAGADVVVTCLFGPESVRETVIDPDALARGVLWLDATTIGPEDAAAASDWATRRGVRYVHTPVVGTIGPARNGALGVYVGAADPQDRAAAVGIVRPWADPERLREVPSAAHAATAKLLANLALAVSMQGLVEALRLGHAQGLDTAGVLDLLDKTALAFPAGMKRRHLLDDAYDDAHFTADALAKDLRLMLRATPDPLPAATAALESFAQAQRSGLGEWDISVIARPGGHGAAVAGTGAATPRTGGSDPR